MNKLENNNETIVQQIFKNEEFGKIRTVQLNNETYFVGKDVAEALQYSEPHKAITRHIEEDDRMKHPVTDETGRTQDSWIINESGLYALIFGSKLESAKRFKHWVTSEVLPQIRKTGGYIPVKEEDSDLEILAKAVLISQKTIEEKNKKIKEQQEQISELSQFHDDFINTEGLRSIEEVAKILSEGKMGRNQLFAFLRDCKIIYYKNGINLPYQRYIKQGLFKVRESLGKNGQYYHTTYATTKGEEYIRNLMYKQGLLISTFIITSQKGINNYE